MSFAHLKMTLSAKQDHEEYAPRLRWTAIERAVEEFEAICERICNCEGKDRTFNLGAHLEVPSRENPTAAAFAVNATKRSVL